MLLPLSTAEEDEGAATPKVLEYVAVLSTYRSQSEAEGRYEEAQRAHQKLQTIIRDEEEVGSFF
jgi:hypothetical protein